MRFDEARQRIETALRGALPGPDAQLVMAPQPQRKWPAGFRPERIRHAAGLLLVFPSGDRMHVVLTVRTDSLGHHGGQVSLPGGALDPGETFEQAALREAHEEIGLNPTGVRLLGPLTPLDIPVSGFRLHPIVAVVERRPRLSPADAEVARILEIPIDELADPARFRRVDRVWNGRPMTTPLFLAAGTEIWGATAMALAEFLALLGWPGPAL